jgi:NAD(P)-dependent dehydrogenase (short-subunit alcohol dehydrogenase family)
MTLHHNNIRGKVVAITGGARGIGKATGEAFLRAGARVALGDIDTELVEKTAVELAEVTGGDVCGLALDVTGREAFAAFLDNAEARLGPLDVLVNNAGIMPTGWFVDEDDAMTDRMLRINLCGVLNGSKLAAQRLSGRGGHIVNIASVAGVAGFPGVATYCATKHAIVGFSETLHLELAGTGIGVTAVLPGLVHTELSAGIRAPRWVRPMTDVEPEDVAATVVAVVGSRRTPPSPTWIRRPGRLTTAGSLARHHPNSLRGRTAQVDCGGPAIGGFHRDGDHAGEFAAGEHPEPRVEVDADAVEVAQHLGVFVGYSRHDAGLAVGA